MNARAAVVALLLFAACSGHSYDEADGSEGAPCYPNGTCDAGLSCASGRCVKLDAADASTDAGDTAQDSGSPDDAALHCPPPDTAPPVRCEDDAGTPLDCSNGEKCCVDQRACLTSCSTQREIECFGRDQCPDGEICCVQAQAVPADATCPRRFDQLVRVYCAPACLGADVPLCRADDACKAGRCESATLSVDFGAGAKSLNVVVGACL